GWSAWRWRCSATTARTSRRGRQACAPSCGAIDMKGAIAGLDPASYRPHRLHDPGRRWPQTNCYVDLLIEVMHATGHDPAAALGFTVAQDFEGDQFTFFKFPAADLQLLAGLDIQELAVFDRLETHALVQIERGRLPLVEVDAFFLPDTKG